MLASMAAGLTARRIQELAGADYPVIRLMPNTPAAVGAGVIQFCGVDTREEELEDFQTLLAPAGLVDQVDEGLIDAACALSGCGPAFCALLAEALADGAVACGLPRDKAHRYAAQTMEGTARLMRQTGAHPGVVKDAVCSPGGSTIQGVRAGGANGFRAAAMDAVIAAFEKNPGPGQVTHKGDRYMRIVVKVGTSTLAHATGRLNIRHVEQLVKVLSDLKNAGHEMILVSSGAIGMGVGKLNLPGRPGDMPTKQAAAAVGQCELMYTYDKLFSEYNHTVAQILLTGEDVDHADRRRNFENTMSRLLELGALPIINENDTIATEEIKVGDNDTLGAIVACSAKADLLVLLSDIEGLYTADPRQDPAARLIPVVEEVTPDILALAGRRAATWPPAAWPPSSGPPRWPPPRGCDMVITNGEHPEVLYDIAEGKAVGTRFVAKSKSEELPPRRNPADRSIQLPHKNCCNGPRRPRPPWLWRILTGKTVPCWLWRMR
ncbi:MAG: glutamate 5-kinase [Lawsonibacter sp.]